MHRTPVGNQRLLLVGTCGILGVLMLAACGSKPYGTSVDRSLVTDSPCAAPCWQGIVPGTTSSTEAMEILENSPYVREETIRWGEMDGSGRATWSYDLAEFYGENIVTWENGIVQDVSLLIAYDLTLREAIEKFGYPEYLLARPCPLQQPCLWVRLLYPQMGMMLTFDAAWPDPRVEGSTLIEGAVFCAQGPAEDRFAYTCEHADWPAVEQAITCDEVPALRSWSGFGRLLGVYYESTTEMWQLHR